MAAQVELVVLLAVIAGGIAYVVVRVRRGALDEERLRERERAGDDTSAPDEPTEPDGSHDRPDAGG